MYLALRRFRPVAAAPPADESTPDKALVAAKESFEAAQNLFVRGEYASAAEKFLSAYEQKAYPAFLFNVAVSYEKAKQLEKAKQYFERYLEKDPNANDAAQVKLRLEVINQLLAPPRRRHPRRRRRRPLPEPTGRAPAGPDGGAPATTSPPPPPPPPPAAIAPMPVLTEIETKGLVVIDSKPQGATIYLNDKRKGPFGKTPWQGSLKSKPVRLILESKGWKPEERAISPRSDKLIDVYIALSEEHYLGWVEIASNVPGADVYIDRKEIGAIGRTPFTGHLKPGKHTIFVERFGFDPVQRAIEINPAPPPSTTSTCSRPRRGGWSSAGAVRRAAA